MPVFLLRQPRHPVPLDWLHVPDGLSAGDQFRLLFVSHRTTDATSDEIETYNEFVQQEAAGRHHADGTETEGPLLTPGPGRPTWRGLTDPLMHETSEHYRALVSTSAVSARENAEMQGAGVPIYWVAGDFVPHGKVADDYADFFDGSWDTEDRAHPPFGNAIDAPDELLIFTGSWPDGSSYTGPGVPNVDLAMGSTTGVGIGRLNDAAAGVGPLGAGRYVAGDQAGHVYGISPIYTVVPIPPSPPFNVGALRFTHGGVTNVTWFLPEHDGGAPILTYEIWTRSPERDEQLQKEPWTLYAEVDASRFINEGFANFDVNIPAAFDVQITAWNGHFRSEPSQPLWVRVPADVIYGVNPHQQR